MSVSITEFGRSSDGTVIHRATLKNERITAEILSYAGVVHRLVVPDRKGRPVDVALGYPTVPDYEVNSGDAMGAIVGRYANRIGGAQFPLYEDIVHVTANQSGNCLHSGLHGLHHTVFAMEVTPGTDDSVTLTARSPDGMDGFPGNVDFEIQYRLAGCGLVIQYSAATDAPTVCNLTNHSYFNLNGCQDGSILGHRLQIFADRLTEADAESLPNGTIYQAAGTPMDFRQLTAIGERIDDSFQQLQWGAGYDHNWILSDQKETSLHKAAYAEGDKSGISLTVYTDLPGLQFYSGNFLDGTPGKGGISYGKRSSFALETQYYPNSPAHPEFPQPILKKDETWKSVTVFAAGTVK